MTTNDPFITRSEFCKRLNIHPDTARRRERQGKIPSFAITGNCVRYRLSDVERLLDDARFVKRQRPGPKPKIRITQPVPPKPAEDTAVETCAAMFETLAFATERRATAYRVSAEMAFQRLERDRGRSAALAVFINEAGRRALSEVSKYDDIEASRALVSAIGSLRFNDGEELRTDSEAARLLTDLGDSIAPPSASTES